MELIGQQETARRERDARMAKAAADQEAAVREAEAEQVKINAARDVSLRRAETETQTAAAQARAAQSGPLAEAEATQEVTRKQTELAELEAARKEKELLTSIVRPAEADAAAQIRRAEGEKARPHRAGPGRGGAGQAGRLGRGRGDRHQGRGAGPGRVGQRRRPRRSGRPSRATPRPASRSPRARPRPRPWPCAPRPIASSTRRRSSRRSSRCCRRSSARRPNRWRNIDSLTVLSNDGASDVVKNVTRTVTEASATVKGLTGIDIPDLLNKAVGSTEARRRVRPPARPRRRDVGGSGGSEGTQPPSDRPCASRSGPGTRVRVRTVVHARPTIGAGMGFAATDRSDGRSGRRIASAAGDTPPRRRHGSTAPRPSTRHSPARTRPSVGERDGVRGRQGADRHRGGTGSAVARGPEAAGLDAADIDP